MTAAIVIEVFLRFLEMQKRVKDTTLVCQIKDFKSRSNEQDDFYIITP